MKSRWIRSGRRAAAGGVQGRHPDRADCNGVIGKLRPRKLGFDVCMFRLHKTFGAPQRGVGGPAAGAYGCSAELAPFGAAQNKWLTG
ncbi:hypothetical protein Aab01nite_82060 [Paractinoplanes abujensis]|nr:hypothetical protein Aab01nite_82060 [Actinoplanes abujensis]